jgi:pyruvate carboxylase
VDHQLAGHGGEPLLAIEAMKMQTQIAAERDVAIDEVWVKPGDAVSTGDLLVVLA